MALDVGSVVSAELGNGRCALSAEPVVARRITLPDARALPRACTSSAVAFGSDVLRPLRPRHRRSVGTALPVVLECVLTGDSHSRCGGGLVRSGRAMRIVRLPLASHRTDTRDFVRNHTAASQARVSRTSPYAKIDVAMSTAEQVIAKLARLSPEQQAEILRIVDALASQNGSDEAGRAPSAFGLWKGLGVDISDEEIAQARREMWGGFPRQDIF